MVEIVLGAVGAEGLRDIPIDEEFGTNLGCLENGCQIRDTATQMAGSHWALLVREDSRLEFAEDATPATAFYYSRRCLLFDEMGM